MKQFLVVLTILVLVATSTFAQNYALQFNSDQTFDFESVEIDSIPAFDTLTVELWVKLDGTNENYNIGLIDIDSDNDYFMYVVGEKLAWVGKPGQCKTADSISADSWHHLAMVLESDVVKAMYIDGISQSLDDPNCTNPPKQTWSLGSLYNDATLALYGSMDELRVWNVERTSAEINANKDRELVGDESGLVGYWNFNDGSGTSLTDITSNNRNGVLKNMESEDWVDGAPVSGATNPSKSLYFSGSAGNQSVVAKGFKDLVDSVYTQELWIKPDAFAASWGEEHLVQFYGDYHSQLYLKNKNADTAWVYTQDGNASWENGIELPLDKWAHLAYVRDGVSDSASIYVNGILASRVVLDHEHPSSGDSNLVIGLYSGYEGGEASYSGLMDELRVWNKALTIEEIQADMVKELTGSEEGLVAYYDFNNQSGNILKDKTSNGLDGMLKNMSDDNWKTENTPFTAPVIQVKKELVALWHFDEGEGTTAADVSGNGKDGSLNDGAIFTTGAVSGTAIVINGAGHVLVPSGGSFNSITKKITLEAWVNPAYIDNNKSRHIVLTQWDGGAKQRAYALIVETFFNDVEAGSVRFLLSADGEGNEQIDLYSKTKLEANVWSHIVATSDGDSVRIFINGVQDSSVCAAPTGGIHVPTTDLYVGDWGWGKAPDNSEQFSGMLDEIAIYNYALSADTILAHYQNTPTSVNKEENTLPVEYALSQNYPNPFNPTTVITFALPKESDVQLSVYNVLGEKVAELVNSKMSAGKYSVNFNATSLATGMYIYRIKADNFVAVRKMLLIK